MVVTVFSILLVITLVYATITDWKFRRIPNNLTFPMMICGLILQFIVHGTDGLMFGALGAGVALAVLLMPFYLQWIGAGDVKLAMAIGVLMGADFVFTGLIATFVIAGVIVLVNVICQHKLSSSLRYLLLSWQGGHQLSFPLKVRIPYTPAMVAGCIIAGWLTLL